MGLWELIIGFMLRNLIATGFGDPWNDFATFFKKSGSKNCAALCPFLPGEIGVENFSVFKKC
jgi:hypothetical protein